MADDDSRLPVGRVKDGRTWRIGTDAEVAWIADGTSPGLTMTSAIPPVFDVYATIVLPDRDDDRQRHDQAVLAVLSERSAGQRWWLGYLDTGAPCSGHPGSRKQAGHAARSAHYPLATAARPLQPPN